MKNCPKCGENLVAGESFCTHCGTAVDKDQPKPDSKETASGKPHRAVALLSLVIVLAVAVGGLVVWLVWRSPPAADPEPAAPPASVTIGEVTVTDAGQRDTRFEFTAEAQVPNPKKALRCQISYDATVFTAAGTMVTEPSESVDFTLTVATAAMDLMESLFPDPGVQVICTADGASASRTIDRTTGAVLTPSPTETAPSPNPSGSDMPPMDQPDAPALQINLSEFTVAPEGSTLDFVTTVEGATAGETLECVVSNIEPRDLLKESRTLAGGVEELSFSVDLTDQYEDLQESAWFIFVCKAQGGSAYETVARPAG
ncbi:MAG: zinc-ribbon domain-containing protein [Actinomycetia bacterium]|nr:zinc-ribbon domain-containing protein [Actinomycetes bacterium]